jgi:glutathione S-transferase
MITLFNFGPAFGLPDPSPFVTKAHMLLRLAGLTYETDTKGFNKAPKGKLPYINDNGTIIADSTFIRLHLEQAHKFNFDKGYGKRERAVAWAAEKLLEDRANWYVVTARWMDDANFNKGPRMFFNQAPALIRPLIVSKIRRDVRRNLHGQGMGRHSTEELAQLASLDFKAISDILGKQKYLLGDSPCGADATVYAFVSAVLCPLFEHPVRDAAAQFDNLQAYSDCMKAEFFPEL